MVRIVEVMGETGTIVEKVYVTILANCLHIATSVQRNAVIFGVLFYSAGKSCLFYLYVI